MEETKLQLTEFGYLYNSLYTYRRKIEADIRTIIKADTQASLVSPDAVNNNNAQALLELTQKLRKISIITSRVISLNKGYKRSA